MDSPRGRIELMKLGQEREPLTDVIAGHFDRCLGCMACVSACPSGVRYDLLITAKKSKMEESRRRPLGRRLLRGLIFGLFPYPRRLRLLRMPLRISQWLRIPRFAARSRFLARAFPALTTMAALAPPPQRPTRQPVTVAAAGPRRAVVGMLLGCVQREFFPQVNEATVRVLSAEGCEVVIPPAQGCCGALSLHSGRREEAAGFAKRTVATFETAEVETVVVNAAGCGSAMKEYAELLADDPQWAVKARRFADRVQDLSQFLSALGPVAVRHRLPVTVAYQDACHLAHAQRIRSQPRQLLEAIPDLEVREIADADICCGSAGVYNLLQPQAAAQLGDRKAVNVTATGAQLLVSANPGCAMQIGAALARDGRRMPVAHIAEVLDAAIAGDDIAGLLRR